MLLLLAPSAPGEVEQLLQKMRQQLQEQATRRGVEAAWLCYLRLQHERELRERSPRRLSLGSGRSAAGTGTGAQAKVTATASMAVGMVTDPVDIKIEIRIEAGMKMCTEGPAKGRRERRERTGEGGCSTTSQ